MYKMLSGVGKYIMNDYVEILTLEFFEKLFIRVKLKFKKKQIKLYIFELRINEQYIVFY